MKMKSSVTAFLLLVSIIAIQAQAQTKRDVLRIESVQANFTQKKQLPILFRPIISKGRFVFKAPDSLRWEYFSPIHTVLLMDDGSISKFVERDGKFIEEHGMGVDSMQIVLAEITSWLDGEIRDTATFKVQNKGTYSMTLVPRETALKKIISHIDLKLLGKTGLMESVTIHEGPGAFTRMVFSEAVLNEKEGAVLPEIFKNP